MTVCVVHWRSAYCECALTGSAYNDGVCCALTGSAYCGVDEAAAWNVNDWSYADKNVRLFRPHPFQAFWPLHRVFLKLHRSSMSSYSQAGCWCWLCVLQEEGIRITSSVWCLWWSLWYKGIVYLAVSVSSTCTAPVCCQLCMMCLSCLLPEYWHPEFLSWLYLVEVQQDHQLYSGLELSRAITRSVWHSVNVVDVVCLMCCECCNAASVSFI